MQIRKISATEVEAFRRVNNYAFGRWTDDSLPPVAFLGVEPDASIGLIVEGEIVSVLRNLHFRQSVRGVLKEMGGIASVSSYPEARRRGYVRELMLQAFADMREKGYPVSALHPFRDTFYARYGYVTANSSLEVTMPTASLRGYLQVKLDEGEWSVKRQAATAVYDELFAFWCEVSMPQYSGYALRDAEPEAWQQWFKNQQVVFVRQGGQIQAAARYKLDGFAENGQLIVSEMNWRNYAARDRLLAYLALHGEQTYSIRFKLPQDSRFQRWILQPTTPMKVDIDRVPMMVRVMDVVDALNGLPMPTTAVESVVIDVNDPDCPWNKGQFRLTAVGGKLQVEPTTEPAEARFKIEGVSAVAFGARSVAECIHLGWITAVDAQTTAVLDAWFPEETLFNPNYF